MRKVFMTFAVMAATLAMMLVLPVQHARAEGDNWLSIRKDFFKDRAITDNAAALAIDAPEKAEDSALVPISIYISGSVAEKVTSLHIFIDNNPAPLVGHFKFGPAAGDGARSFSTRVRFDTFSYVRAVVETADGSLLMTTKFVKAAGGCSAPAIKDFQETMAHTGEMQLKRMEKQQFASQKRSAVVMREGQVMLRHPNYSGMQMDPASGTYIPARYVREIEVKRAGELIFTVETGISLSTNPNIRFNYGSAGDEELSATAKDSDGAAFSAAVAAGDS